MPISAERQFLVKVAGIDGYFATRAGGEVEAEATREFDGGSLEPEVLMGPATTGDLTIGRPYKPERDAPMLRSLRPLVGRWRTSVTVTPTDEDLVPVEEPTTYTGKLRRATDPDTNAGSGTSAKAELVFAIERVR